jgi:UDP-N-acetylglucosamine--N-acetylmuramyl-(pentapeptide) pyrophosphoryl-undecaprenol N-acetylglucosamine transferase
MTAKGIPGILIPYPFATENHQEYNARALVEAGAAELINDRELKGDNLTKRVEGIIFDRAKREKMAQKSKEAGKPEAIEKIIQIIEKYL